MAAKWIGKNKDWYQVAANLIDKNKDQYSVVNQAIMFVAGELYEQEHIYIIIYIYIYNIYKL